MPSIRVHQDIFNYEKRRKGFTERQLVSFVVAGILVAGMAAIFGYALKLNWIVVAVISVISALPAVLAGFMPINNMPAEEYFARFFDINKRGNIILWEGEEVVPLGKETSRVYKKKARKRDFEQTSHL